MCIRDRAFYEASTDASYCFHSRATAITAMLLPRSSSALKEQLRTLTRICYANWCCKTDHKSFNTLFNLIINFLFTHNIYIVSLLIFLVIILSQSDQQSVMPRYQLDYISFLSLCSIAYVWVLKITSILP